MHQGAAASSGLFFMRERACAAAAAAATTGLTALAPSRTSNQPRTRSFNAPTLDI
eukprot:CAMPEP_0206490854 /NCGR_PEP_ID=MMETSP0324_2-20121206/44455_1 /ASSEMBLY_ACC=CAM_ASM_000836 /TAXON_ID=2866 /ORGANISM="Crypthecodinium cohnii, Strain Seligo" /LENGTH=54 /DNA_ID=CAMNT_0053971547 /DNA_START=236 /DNA_END=397 /DNA_ORIENTATION=-